MSHETITINPTTHELSQPTLDTYQLSPEDAATFDDMIESYALEPVETAEPSYEQLEELSSNLEDLPFRASTVKAVGTMALRDMIKVQTGDDTELTDTQRDTSLQLLEVMNQDKESSTGRKGPTYDPDVEHTESQWIDRYQDWISGANAALDAVREDVMADPTLQPKWLELKGKAAKAHGIREFYALAPTASGFRTEVFDFVRTLEHSAEAWQAYLNVAE